MYSTYSNMAYKISSLYLLQKYGRHFCRQPTRFDQHHLVWNV